MLPGEVTSELRDRMQGVTGLFRSSSADDSSTGSKRSRLADGNRSLPHIPQLTDGGVRAASDVAGGDDTTSGVGDRDDIGRFGMVIDLKKCVACYGCVVSCEVENFLPKDIFWSWIETEDLPNGWVEDEALDRMNSFERVHVPMLCMHCGDPEKGETAPCQDVCPTGATEKRDDGTVTIDPTKCIGCGYCIQACPYGARMKIPDEQDSYFPSGPTDREQFRERFPEDDHRRHQSGTIGKCEFCKHRTDEGMNPKCVTNCIGKARHFGDINDPDSKVSTLIEEHDGFQISPDLDTNPSVYYLPPDRGE